MNKMDFKYYKKASMGASVSWRIVGDKDNKISGSDGCACFSPITYGAVPTTAKKIIVTHPLSYIPYSKEIMEKWVDELNELGFPCSIEFKENKAEFPIILSDYKYKIHLNCVLQLIRCLYEQYINFVPEYYFTMLEKLKNPTVEEKFAILQEAHAETHRKNIYMNWNHTVTKNGNFRTPLTKKELFERIEKTKEDIHASKRMDVTGLWKN